MALCLRRKHIPLSFHSIHGAFSRSIKFNVNKALFLHWLTDNVYCTYHRYSKYWLVGWLVGWLVVLGIYVTSAVFQPYRDLEAGDNQSLKIQVARPGIEPRSSCSTSQELNHSATTAPYSKYRIIPRCGGLVVVVSHLEVRHCGVAPLCEVAANVSWQIVWFGIHAVFKNLGLN